MQTTTFLRYLLVMAGVTYLIRMLPFTAIRGRIRSAFMQSFLYYVPFAVLGAMTVPAIFESTGSIPASVCGAVAALALAWMDKGLLTVAAASCAAAYIASLIF